MSADVVKYAFIAGEISSSLFGRTDLTKYDLALAEAFNFFVDYRGGLSSRPGFEFVDYAPEGDERLVPFEFSADLSNSYAILFGDGVIRFLQDGGYVLTGGSFITAITQTKPATVTSTAHGFVENQWVKIAGAVGMTGINGLTFMAVNVTTDTYDLAIPSSGDYFDATELTAYVGSAYAFPVYEVASPFTSDDLPGLTFEQYRDLVRITSKTFPTYNLIRHDHDDWELLIEEISPYLYGPTIASSTASDVGDAQVVFGVTAVQDDGTETAIGPLFKISNCINYVAQEGSVSITWGVQADASHYNVYRSIVSVTETLLPGTEMGYVGRSFGTKFTDPNIVPDFTRVPPINFNPFAPGAIERINITAGGSGYPAFGTTISITDPTGTGFDAHVVTDDLGVIVNVIIKSGGSGYTNPVVSFAGGGSLATAEAEVRELTGTYPALSNIFQQRQIYASTENQPITIWGSRIKQFSNFNSSPLVLDDDSFEFDLDTPAVAPIVHLLTTRGGLLAMTQKDVWLMNGGSPGEPMTPTNALAEPQSYTGVRPEPKPLPISNDLLFVEGKGHAVRMLTYNEISRVYGSEDKSILSNHLFGRGKDIVRWAYQESPFKVVWCVREDGALLAFTSVRSEEVFAWTPGGTQGQFVDLVGLREGDADRIYVVVRRRVAGGWAKFIERMDLHDYINVEDAFCVDAGLKLTGQYPDGELTIFHEGDVWRCETTVDLGPTGVDAKLRGGGGIFNILSKTSATSANLEMIVPPTNWMAGTDDTQTMPIASGDWTVDTPSATLSGLWHLEGQYVSVLGDGNVFPKQLVNKGSITLDAPVSRAIVGLGYQCRARTLPIIMPQQTIESKRKRIVGIGVRMERSRGLKTGPNLDDLQGFRERTTETYGQAIYNVNGMKYQLQYTDINEDGQTYLVQDDPLPMNILSIVPDLEVGDEPD